MASRWTELGADIRHALRQYRRTPGFTAVAVLTIALGIGANAAMFSIVNGILLRPLPYAEPERLVLLHESNARTGELLGGVSLEDLQDWKARSRRLSDVAGYADVSTILTGRGNALELQMTYVTDAFFGVLGVGAVQGRSLQEEDHRLRQRNAVVSHAFWLETLGGAPDAVGSTLLLRGDQYTVVGVMPAGMRHPTPETDVWVPQSLVEPNMFSTGPPTREHRYLQSIGRLADDATVAQAQQELTSITAQLATEYPASNADWTAAAVVPLQEAVTGDVDRALLVVLGVVGFILLIGCANLANLMLARGSTRTREIAIRAALGAGQRRLLRQLLTESLVLAFIGGVAGLLLAYWGMRTMLALSADTLPRVEDVRIDGSVILFCLLLTTLAGVLFGLVPARRMARLDPQHDLRGGRGTVGADGGRLRSALVVAQVTLAVLLVTGAGLMARSFLALRSVDAGFDPEHVLTMTMQINMAGVPDDEMAPYLVQRREQVLAGVREMPGVEAAGMINVFPLARDGAFSLEYQRADRPPEETGVMADTRYVDPGYADAMGIPLLRGEGLPVSLEGYEVVPALMSESAARRLWPEEEAVGRRIRVGWGEAVVVGVVGDVRQLGLAQAPEPAIYFPQLVAPRLMATLVVRTTGEPMTLAEPIRRLVADIDANQPIRRMMPLTEVMSESLARDRFFTVLFLVFGGLALTLAAVGIYGVLSYAVRQRTQEIGVRMALGASRLDVLGMVTGAGMKLVLVGMVLGTLAALALSRVLASLLYDVEPTDPATFAMAAGFLAVIALLATAVPAWRAMRVSPTTALRAD